MAIQPYFANEPFAAGLDHRPLGSILDELRSQLTAIDVRVQRVTEGLSTAQLDRQPGPKRWSVAQCLEHLILFDSHYFAGIEERIAQLPPARAEATYTMKGFDKWAYTFFGEKPPIRIPTISSFDPHFDRTYGATILVRYRDHLSRLDQQFRLALDHDVARLRVHSPATSLVRFPYPAIAIIAVAHHRRHLGQAERTRAAIGL